MKKKIGMMVMAMLLLMVGCASKTEEAATLLKEGKFAEAAAKYEESVDEGKELAESFRGLGICYFEQEKYEEALTAFEQALNEGTEETATLYNLCGISALNMGDAGSAVYYFEEGQRFADAGQELLKEMAFNVIVCYEELGEYELAKEAADTYLEQYPDDEKVLKEQEFLSTQS